MERSQALAEQPPRVDFDARLETRRPQKGRKLLGQSLLELALILPVLLLLLGGLVEVGVFINQYLTALDLTREAARFASVRDPFALLGDQDCTTTSDFNFYYDTSCIFLDTGFNPYLGLRSDKDDVVISVFTVTDNVVSNRWPAPTGYWALSDNDDDAANNGNWQKDCQGHVIMTEPFFTDGEVNALFQGGAPGSKGLVAVEVYYCYYQVLGLPLFSQLLPNPLKLHAYTVMPIPEAQPTPTPISPH